MATNDLLNKISAYKSLCQANNPLASIGDRLSLSEINNANILPFLLDIIVVLAGRDALQGVLQRLIDDFVPAFEQEAKNLLIEATTNSRIAGVRIGSIPCLSAGNVRIPADSLDFFDRLKDGSRKLSKLQETIRSAATTGQQTKIDDKASIILDSVTKEYSVIFDSVQGDQKFGEFMQQVIDSYFELDLGGILDDLLSELFNTRTQSNKGEKDKLLEKLLSEADPAEVEFTRFDFLAISRENSRVAERGFVIGGCDPERMAVEESDLDLIFESGTENFASSVGGYVSGIAGGSQEAASNASQTMIERLISVLLERILLSSEAVLVLAIGRIVSNGCDYGPEFSGFIEFTNQMLPRIKCLIIGLRDALFDFLVDIIEEQLQEIIACLVLEYAKERAESYSRIITTLL